MRRVIFALLAAVSLGGAGQAGAQALGQVESPILTIETDALFTQSVYGQRIAAELEAEGAILAAENRRLEAELSNEEKDLTEKRKTLPSAEFRALADAFDTKVQAFRTEQDAKAVALRNRSEQARLTFLQAVQPVLQEIMQDAKAAVIMDRRSLFLSADAIDITELAIQRVDALLGEGIAPDTAPEQ